MMVSKILVDKICFLAKPTLKFFETLLIRFFVSLPIIFLSKALLARSAPVSLVLG
jgi:hypothetical protein